MNIDAKARPTVASSSSAGAPRTKDQEGWTATLSLPNLDKDHLKRVRILCCDDLPALRSCYHQALTRSGYEATVVANGAEAWEALQRGSFDLLITDSEMPRLNGPGLVSRARSAGLVLPIIVAASDADFFSEEPNYCLQVVILRKPFPLQELLETVARSLRAVDCIEIKAE